MLVDLSAEHNLSHWAPYGARYRRIIALRGGNVSANSQGPNASNDEIDLSDQNFRSLPGLNELVEALTNAGRSAEGLALLNASAAHSSEAGCFTPELLRLRGELLRSRTAPVNANPSEDLFRQALELARQQGALWWELRAATSLARLLRGQGCRGDAIACLQPIYDRFTEGFDTADLIAAKQLLDELSDASRR
jgi:hypothetical protein